MSMHHFCIDASSFLSLHRFFSKKTIHRQKKRCIDVSAEKTMHRCKIPHNDRLQCEKTMTIKNKPRFNFISVHTQLTTACHVLNSTAKTLTLAIYLMFCVVNYPRKMSKQFQNILCNSWGFVFFCLSAFFCWCQEIFFRCVDQQNDRNIER